MMPLRACFGEKRRRDGAPLSGGTRENKRKRQKESVFMSYCRHRLSAEIGAGSVQFSPSHVIKFSFD